MHVCINVNGMFNMYVFCVNQKGKRNSCFVRRSKSHSISPDISLFWFFPNKINGTHLINTTRCQER